MKSLSFVYPPGTGFRTPALVLTAAFSLLLAGCASMAPPYAQPALPVAPTFESVLGAEAPAPAGADAALVDWRAYFTDPALQAVIGMALEHNRDLRQRSRPSRKSLSSMSAPSPMAGATADNRSG